MIVPVTSVHSEAVRRLLAPLDHNLVLSSVIAGKSPGFIYGDDANSPRSILAGTHHRVYLAGDPDNPQFNLAAHRLLLDKIIPDAKVAGKDAFILEVSSESWETALPVVLAGLYPLRAAYEYYECHALAADPKEYLLLGFELHRVDGELVNQTHLGRLEDLLEELVSERPSVADFLEKSFGVAAVTGDELAAWCLSEYNIDGRCEVGVATAEPYQRRGLGTAVSLALVEMALARGYHTIGWHCWQDNVPSSALARRAGFHWVRANPVFLVVFHLTIQFAVHGNTHRARGEHQQAQAWYERALAQGDAPAWVYFNLARSQAQSGLQDRALQSLRLALDHGFDVQAIDQNVDFAPLRKLSAWQELFSR